MPNSISSKRGYVSFLLFFILASILILPYSIQFQTPQSPSLAPAYSAKSILDNHVSLKRSLALASQHAYDEIKPMLASSDLTKSFASSDFPSSFLPPTSAPNSFSSIQEAKEYFLRLSILKKWGELEGGWNADTNFYSEIYCASAIPAQSTLANLPPNSSPALASIFSSCSNNINFHYNLNSGEESVLISNVFLKSTHLPSNASMESEIMPMELK